MMKPNEIEALVKALEAGNYNAAPTKLVQGTVFQIEDLDVSKVKFEEMHLKPGKIVFKKCECGSAKTGIKAFAPGHSTWCPVHTARFGKS